MVDFEENLSHQEGIITEMYITPDLSYIEQPQKLTKLVNTSKVVQKYLPRHNQEKVTKRHTLAPYHQ